MPSEDEEVDDEEMHNEEDELEVEEEEEVGRQIIFKFINKHLTNEYK